MRGGRAHAGSYHRCGSRACSFGPPHTDRSSPGDYDAPTVSDRACPVRPPLRTPLSTLLTRVSKRSPTAPERGSPPTGLRLRSIRISALSSHRCARSSPRENLCPIECNRIDREQVWVCRNDHELPDSSALAECRRPWISALGAEPGRARSESRAVRGLACRIGRERGSPHAIPCTSPYPCETGCGACADTGPTASWRPRSWRARTLRLPARRVLRTVQPPAHAGRGEGPPSPLAGHARPARTGRAGAEPTLAASGIGLRGPLPRPGVAHAAGGAARARLRVVQRAPARRADGAGATGPLLLGGPVRGLGRASALRSQAVAERSHLVALGRLGVPRAIDPGEIPGRRRPRRGPRRGGREIWL